MTAWLPLVIATSSLWIVAPLAYAQFSDGSTISPQSDGGISNSNVRVHGAVGTETIQYPTKISGQPELSQNNRIEAALTIDSETTRAQSRFQLQASKSLGLSDQYFAIQELYSGTPGGNGFYLGRKLADWSLADQDWNLGLWQPLYQNDTLRPIQAGLTGGFYIRENENFQILAFLSPVFIPTLGTDITERNGSLVADSRWVRPFPSQVTINNAPTQLTYKLDMPNNRDLVVQPSVGARLRFGPREKGLWGAFAFASKPMNALSIKYDAALSSGASGVSGQATVVPLVTRHQIMSADLGFNEGAAKYGASLMVDAPASQSVSNGTNSSGFQTDYYQQQPKPIQLLSLRAGAKTKIRDYDVNWTAMYLRAKTDPTPDVDANGVERSQMVPNRLLFTNAASLQGDVPITSEWTSQIRYLRDFDQSGTLWHVEGQYKPRREWALHVGLDILGVDNQQAQENDTRFLNYYRQNDRVYGGFDYVF